MASFRGRGGPGRLPEPSARADGDLILTEGRKVFHGSALQNEPIPTPRSRGTRPARESGAGTGWPRMAGPQGGILVTGSGVRAPSEGGRAPVSRGDGGATSLGGARGAAGRGGSATGGTRVRLRASGVVGRTGVVSWESVDAPRSPERRGRMRCACNRGTRPAGMGRWPNADGFPTHHTSARRRP